MSAEQLPDPVAAVDALVGELLPELPVPALCRRDVVLVTGPWLAGVSGVAAALRARLPDHEFVEAEDLAAGDAPQAVVFVVSAAAVLTESDCALLDAAAIYTDAVICAVAKIDVHRAWRDVLAANRQTLAAHASRYRDVAWVGVAAAPERGEPRRDDLVAQVHDLVGDIDVDRRNRLRMWESRLRTGADRIDHEVQGPGRRTRVATLQEQREAVLRQRRLAKSERGITLRSQIQQARVQLNYFARNRCTSLRSELQEDAAAMTRRGLPTFVEYVRGRVEGVVADVDQGGAEQLSDVASELGLTVELPGPSEATEIPIPGAKLDSHRLESQLMMLLGAGFGLGAALTLSRLFADLAPAWTAAGVVCCTAIGVALTVWVVRTRRLLRDRAVLDRWVGEVTTTLQTAVEQRAATRVLAAEPVLTAAVGEQDAAEAEQAAAQVAVIDAELREHAVAAARAVSVRDREMPGLAAALDRVRAELGGARRVPECADTGRDNLY